MTMAIVHRVATEVFSSSYVEAPIAFLWHLGEPLSVPLSFYEEAFARIAEANRPYGREYFYSFQTNATMIDEQWTDLFQRHHIRLGISVDGPEFIHDRQRVRRDGRGTHAATMRGIGIARDSGIPFSVISVLTNFSLDYPEEMFHFYRENHIEDVGFNIDEIEGVHVSTTFAQSNAAERYERFLYRFVELAVEYKGAVKLREIWTNLRTLALGLNEPYNTTNKPWRILNFDALGNFSTFCPELVSATSAKYENFVMGNVMTGGIDQLPSNSVFQRVYSEIEQGVAICKESCDHWNFCGGGSPSNKFFEYGRFNVSETTTCRIQKKATVNVLIDYLESRFPDNEEVRIPGILMEESSERVD